MTSLASDSVTLGVTQNEQLAEWQGTGRGGGVEGSAVLARSSRFGEPIMQSLYGARTPMIAAEGSTWVVTNTQSTAVTGQNASSFATTTPGLILVNNNAAGSGVNIYPTVLRFQVVAVGTSSTNWLSAWYMDTGNRYSSGGSQFTPTNPNLQVTATKTGALFYFGAITATAANNQRRIHHGMLRSVIPVANDQVTFDFGGSVLTTAGEAEDGTAVLWQVVRVPPVVLYPQQSLLWYDFAGSQGAARTYDNLHLEYIER